MRFRFFHINISLFSFLFAALFPLGFVSCAENNADSSEISKSGNFQFSILNWNVQTFFDGVKDGDEYSEFTKSSDWDVQKYAVRVERLCQVIKHCNADIVVLEELEKEGQLADISNCLAGTFDFSSLYKYAAFSREKGSSIGCGVISRLPILGFSIHSMDFRQVSGEKQPSMRPLMEIILGQINSSPGNSKNQKIKLLVNHWKSKSGGEAESEKWRNRQEMILSKRIQRSIASGYGAVIACGDFNRDIEEFSMLPSANEKANFCLGDERKTPGKTVSVYNPWILSDGSIFPTGSYWYNGKWERIDHFFVSGNCRIKNFFPVTGGQWTDAAGHPARYKIYTGEGYSDHLPIFAAFEVY